MTAEIHTAIPFDVYAEWDLVNNSRLSDLKKRSPHYCHDRMKMGPQTYKSKTFGVPLPMSDAMRFGKLAHLAVLEPVSFQANPVAPQVDRRTKVGREEWQHYLLTTDLPMTLDEYHRAMEISIAVRAHPTAAKLLKEAEAIEASLCWQDEATGLGCKGRPDILLSSAVVDLKLSKGAHPDRFPDEMRTYGYHRQAAHYLNGLKAAGHGADRFKFIAVENTPPYEVVVYELHPDSIEAGRLEVAQLLELYALCEQTGRWEGYPVETQVLSLPEWYLLRTLPEQGVMVDGVEIK